MDMPWRKQEKVVTTESPMVTTEPAIAVEPVVAPAILPETDEGGNQSTVILVDLGATNTYTPYAARKARERAVRINGREYYHVADADDGRWIYR